MKKHSIICLHHQAVRRTQQQQQPVLVYLFLELENGIIKAETFSSSMKRWLEEGVEAIF
jgi:hypothetical protein